MGITLGGIGAAVGGGSALASLLGLGANQPTAPTPAYTPQYLGSADAQGASAIDNLTGMNTGASALPYAQQTFQNLYNNPYASQYQQTANGIAPVAMQAGGQQVGAGSNLIGAGQSLLPYAQQTLQTAYDPQNALYAQQYQQNNDATNAGLAARGIAMTPYGAGVQNTSDQQFNTNWLQTQLQRQQTGAATASALTGAAGTAGTTGAGLQTTGLNTMLQGASLPYSTANTIGTNQNTAIGAYGGAGTTATNTAQTQIADFLQYLGLGNSAASTNNSIYGNQLTQQQNQFNQQAATGKALGTSLSGLGTYFGGNNGVASTNSAGAPVQYTNVGGYSMPTYT